MRIRCLLAVLLFTLTTAVAARAQDEAYYLALGDSLALGIQPEADGSYVATNQGYVDDLYALYHARLPALRLAKLGCSGETTSSMITGLGSGCTYPAGSQLGQAVAFMQSHRVVLVTIDIGADNLLQCLSLTAPVDPACVGNAAVTAANDLVIILGTLRTYAPQTLIVGMNYNDPLVAAWVFGPAGRQIAAASLLATRVFNQAIESVYGLMRVPIADVAATFRTDSFPANVLLALAWTWMSAPPPRGPDVHPNALGYAAIAGSFARTIGSR
jgi:lysophospholipase L1-like esterase